MNQLQVYLKSLHTYTSNNTMVIRALDGLNHTLQEHFQNHPDDTLQIQLLPEETFFNNTLLPIALKDFERIRILTEDLRSLEIGRRYPCGTARDRDANTQVIFRHRIE